MASSDEFCWFPGCVAVTDVWLCCSLPCRCPWLLCWALEGVSGPWWALLESWKPFMSQECWTVPPTLLGSRDPPGKALSWLSPASLQTVLKELSPDLTHFSAYNHILCIQICWGRCFGCSGSRCSSRSFESSNGWEEVPTYAPIFLHQHLMCVV